MARKKKQIQTSIPDETIVSESPKFTHKFNRGDSVKDKISGLNVKVYSLEKDGCYTIDIPGGEWVVWRRESDLS